MSKIHVYRQRDDTHTLHARRPIRMNEQKVTSTGKDPHTLINESGKDSCPIHTHSEGFTLT